jgi:alpha-tubulin suppressor-like RCC1 family protein
VPVAVNADPSLSALYGKLVTAIAAGFGHSLALCSDGTVAAWGLNSYGELGDNSTIGHLVPVAVNTERLISVLHGKVVAAIAAGSFRSLAVCSDGTVAAWGANDSGQLGNDTVETSQAPVAVSTASGVSALSGNTAVATASGYTHSLVLCSDGTVAAWGANSYGQLGDNSTAQRNTPVAVNGSFQFTFTSAPGALFSVLSTKNLALSLSNWSSVTGLTEVSPGQFQFTDTQTTNTSQRFYRVRSP